MRETRCRGEDEERREEEEGVEAEMKQEDHTVLLTLEALTLSRRERPMKGAREGGRERGGEVE